MKYVLSVFYPGIAGYEKKTNYAIGHPPVETEFEAVTHTEARVTAARMFRSIASTLPTVPKYEGQVIGRPHYNVSRA